MSDCLCDDTVQVVVQTEEVATTVTANETDAVAVETVTADVLEIPGDSVVVDNNLGEVIEIVSAGPQAVPEDLVAYAKRVDFEGDTTIYKGEADPGTAESTAAWRIRRITFVGADEDVVEEWGEGTGSFVHAWDDRATLSYS